MYVSCVVKAAVDFSISVDFSTAKVGRTKAVRFREGLNGVVAFTVNG